MSILNVVILGGGTITDIFTPVQISGLSGVVAVSGGQNHSLALKGDGTIWAWGSNEAGQLGDGTSGYRATRVQVGGLSEVVAATPSLALKGDGTVWDWGGNHPAPVEVSGLSGVVAIASSPQHSLALRADGTVWAWGNNFDGLLGDGTTANRSTPVQVNGLTGVVAVAASGDHSLALKGDGTVWFWGVEQPVAFAYGGTTRRVLAPAEVSGLSDVAAIAAGFGYSLAVKRDGTVWAWGWRYGWLYAEPTRNSSEPVQVRGLSGVVAVAAGHSNSLALKADRTVWELGDPASGIRSAPVVVSGLDGVVVIAVGGELLYEETDDNHHHRLAVKRDGTVWAWGYNVHGQLGDGTTESRMTPVQVGGLTGIAAVVAGVNYSVAVKNDGTVWTWGWVPLVDGTSTFRKIPVQVIPPGSPDLTIAMKHAGDFAVGGQGAYTLTITNTGATATSGSITVTDTLPPGLTFVSSTGTGWTCSAAEETVTCANPGPIDPEAASTITLTVEVGPAALSGVTNFATVSNASDRNIANNAVGDPAIVLPGR